jgi:hypothetical protein
MKKGERMNRERIEETVRLWQAQPDKAKGKPTVIARAEGSKAVMEHGSFSWHTDMPVPLGGANEAPIPTALLLSAWRDVRLSLSVTRWRRSSASLLML